MTKQMIKPTHKLTKDDLPSELHDLFDRLVIERDEVGSDTKDTDILDCLIYPEPGRPLSSIEIVIRGLIHLSVLEDSSDE